MFLDSDKVFVLDGGLSNELNKRINFDIHKEPLWTAKALVTEKDKLVDTHLAYLKAGADIIETASYQATLEGFKDFMSVESQEAQGYIKKSVALAKTAVNKFLESEEFQNNDGKRSKPLVAGSVGPYGVYLCDGSEYTGKYMTSVSKLEIEAMHLPRISSLVEGGADILAIETMPSLEEVLIILNLLDKHYPQAKVWVSFSVKEGNPLQTAFGDTMKNAYENVSEFPQVVAFGINCCPPTDVETFLRGIQDYSPVRKPKIIVYPNSGQRWIAGEGWKNETVPMLDSYLNTWIQLGVNIVGGCCQVGAEQISKLRKEVDKLNNK